MKKMISSRLAKYSMFAMFTCILLLITYMFILHGFSPTFTLFFSMPLLFSLWSIFNFYDVFISDKKQIIIKNYFGKKIAEYDINEIKEIYGQFGLPTLKTIVINEKRYLFIIPLLNIFKKDILKF